MGLATYEGRPDTPSPVRLKAYAYIDGFNLYYGCFKRPAPPEWSKYKWLDLQKLCDGLLPDLNVAAIKYYTADVNNRPPDNRQNDRQQAYLKALSTLTRVEIIKGHFLGPDLRWMPLCDLSGNALGANVPVLKTEEKGSDVNLAVDLLYDCVKDLYDCAVVISNDSDLVRSLIYARRDFNKRIVLVNPTRRPVSGKLAPLADDIKDIRQKILACSQFPDEITIGGGSIHRPPAWT
jgi:uncharacterized LabA/DUF88 family protein